MENQSITLQVEKLIYECQLYLTEARKRLLSTFIIFALAFLVGFTFFRQMIEWFFKIFNLGEVQIIITSPFQVFNLAVNTGLFLAIIASTPILIFSLVSFIRPALRKKERKLILPLLVSSLILFIVGFVFGLLLMRWVVLGFSQVFLTDKISNFWDIELFLSQILLTSAFLGLIFQFPLVLFFLVKLDLVKIKALKEKRPLIIVGAFVGVALLPPADGFSLVLMVLPVLILFELTLFLLRGQKREEVKLYVG